jgi:hypothetical protein
MPRERPIVESISPSSNRAVQMRGIISPCTGCKNNIPVNDGELGDIEYVVGPVCPKRTLYFQKQTAIAGTFNQNWSGPIFDEELRVLNPVWPALKKYNNGYAYVFVATYEDNVDNNWNPAFDTEKIACRGPYLIKSTEREWHTQGHLEQGDSVLVTSRRYFIDGQSFEGFVEPAQVWQVSRGYMREIDRNVTKSNSANGSN